MNPGRTDCPDIDIDLCWRRRDEVIRFCYEHWGFERVAMVCNVNRYRLRSAIRDVGRALGLESVQINQLAREGKIKRTSPVYRLAERLVDIPRHLGVHCGGIVVTPCPVSRVAPLERANKGVIITQYDKDAAEAVGLVKIDLLGNRSLSTVNEAIQLVCSGRNGNDNLELATSHLVETQNLASLRTAAGCHGYARVAMSCVRTPEEHAYASVSMAPTSQLLPGRTQHCETNPTGLAVAPRPEDETSDGSRQGFLLLPCYWPKAKNAGGSGAEPLRSTIDLQLDFDPNDRKTADMLDAGTVSACSRASRPACGSSSAG